MITSPNNSKPDTSPATIGVATESMHPRFRWLIIPVVLLYLYGGFMVLNSIIWLFMVVSGCSVTINHTHLASDTQIKFMMLGMILFGIHGCFAIALGRYLWRQSWRRCVVAIAGAIVLAIMVYLTIIIVQYLPPGQSTHTELTTDGEVKTGYR